VEDSQTLPEAPDKKPFQQEPVLVPIDWNNPVQTFNDILLLELIARETFGPRRYT